MNHKKRNYSICYSMMLDATDPQKSSSSNQKSSTKCIKKQKISSSTSFSNSPSFLVDVSEIETNLSSIHIANYSDFDSEMKYEVDKKAPWYEEYLSDIDNESQNETNSSSFDLENDVPDNDKITKNVISNAIESEKTIHRLFDMNKFPNKNNALILYSSMQSYKEKFNRDQFVLSVKATCDFDSSMEIVYDENSILYEYLDDDMLID